MYCVDVEVNVCFKIVFTSFLSDHRAPLIHWKPLQSQYAAVSLQCYLIVHIIQPKSVFHFINCPGSDALEELQKAKFEKIPPPVTGMAAIVGPPWRLVFSFSLFEVSLHYLFTYFSWAWCSLMHAAALSAVINAVARADANGADCFYSSFVLTRGHDVMFFFSPFCLNAVIDSHSLSHQTLPAEGGMDPRVLSRYIFLKLNSTLVMVHGLDIAPKSQRCRADSFWCFVW